MKKIMLKRWVGGFYYCFEHRSTFNITTQTIYLRSS